MRFSEHELTAALTGAAKQVLAARREGVRRRKVDVDAAWDEMDRYRRFQVLDALGTQLLPVLVALPDVEVATGTRPTFTDAQVTTAVESVLGEGAGGLRRKVEIRARVALVQLALGHVPPRSDPDGLVVPDHL